MFQGELFMTSNLRIEALENSCQRLKESPDQTQARKDELIARKEIGMFVIENGNNENQFPSLKEKADNAAIEYEKILNYMVMIKDRTINREKVQK